MAHELDTNAATGALAMFSVKETPWHKEGVVLVEAPRSVEAAARLAGLDFEVELRPACFPIGNGDFLEVAGQFAVVRTDRTVGLGVVGAQYTPHQPKASLEALMPLIDTGLASFETAGSLRGGRDIWAMLRFNVDSPIVREVFAEELVPFGLMTDNLIGRSSWQLAETVVRVVCANTHRMAAADIMTHHRPRVAVRHTASIGVAVAEQTAVLWAGIVERYEAAARQVRALKATRLDEQLFARLVLDVALPLPVPGADTDQARKVAETRRAKIEGKRAAVARLWTEGDGHTGDLSAWEAYNALTQATDHEAEGVFAVKGSRAESLMTGPLGDLKDTVYGGLLAHASR